MDKNKYKSACFEYLVDILAEKNNGLQGFSTLKLIKLLFLTVGVSSSEKKQDLTTIFNKFVAMPFGPVESDVYNDIRYDKLKKYSITSSECRIKDGNETDLVVNETDKACIRKSVDSLLTKNPNILNCEPFELVDISHKWSCWQICFELALSLGRRSIDIPSRMIQKSVRYYK
jgi:hypothetical protein